MLFCSMLMLWPLKKLHPESMPVRYWYRCNWWSWRTSRTFSWHSPKCHEVLHGSHSKAETTDIHWLISAQPSVTCIHKCCGCYTSCLMKVLCQSPKHISIQIMSTRITQCIHIPMHYYQINNHMHHGLKPCHSAYNPKYHHNCLVHLHTPTLTICFLTAEVCNPTGWWFASWK
jgi:hypothetical protein